MKKRVIFTTGGKGGTGKTTLAAILAEWYEENEIPCTLLDLDTENKAKGSLSHFFPARKIDIHQRSGLDAFIDSADETPGVILADMGSGSGKVAADWFNSMYDSVCDRLVFTAISVVTSDPASVESLLTWATYLQDKVDYLVVLNQLEDERPNFTYWENSVEAEKFRIMFQPEVMTMESRIPGLQHGTRNHGLTLKTISERKATQPEFNQSSLVIRAQAYRRHLFSEFDAARSILLP
jgi:MinD-like ATPase involved in chromosome partitioning or flagellar assembly